MTLDHLAQNWHHAMSLATFEARLDHQRRRVTKRNGHWWVTDPEPRDLLGEFAEKWGAQVGEAS